ncbi:MULTISPECIES: hypothetical protein [unclassified Bradyrhizobium]|uniref:hypothetical protein n=1 Tax=Bradyrhizobium sp. USDA 4541 TaxID=2817704 RepID=UPI0020A4F1B4|nr:hypothetical protein [Bradyrhizobium sp. USDA 4541]MCP1854539.1 hypothetical protein [Bradyrhizobium sp. USDA 4541]
MATLEDVFRSLFPEFPADQDPFVQPPRLPADVFAFSAHLLERSGASHHIAPHVPMPDSDFRSLIVDAAMRNRAARLGKEWLRAPTPAGRTLPSAPGKVIATWRRLRKYRDEIVYEPLLEKSDAPDWWMPCLELMMIADEASRDIGFDSDHPFILPMRSAYVLEETEDDFYTLQRASFSLSTAVDDLVCVQPKSRTPTVGCTLRSLSHHLALLPPRGQVRARWVQPVFPERAGQRPRKLGLLLLPYPFRIADDVFEEVAVHAKDAWGWFGVRSSWLPDNRDRTKRKAFVGYVLQLVREARSKGKRVDAVVLPELALNFTQFVDLARALAKDEMIEFLIAGTTHDRSGRGGNFVAIAPFFLLEGRRTANMTDWEKIILVREKHHRWKLNSSQIEAYDLGLDPKKSWWEHLSILSRSLDVLVFRGNSTLTTLICEDLARVDPCQAVVRGVGPNLLIALLMDGPQLENRWPARYATVLAEDPGTSVLTLTSFGLIARQNELGDHPQASAIALWKDDVNGAKKLELPRDCDALVLELVAEGKTERTLDGRSDDGSTHRWVYDAHCGVSVGAQDRPDWITTGVARSK